MRITYWVENALRKICQLWKLHVFVSNPQFVKTGTIRKKTFVTFKMKVCR